MLLVSVIIPIAISWSMSLEMRCMLILFFGVYARMSAIFLAGPEVGGGAELNCCVEDYVPCRVFAVEAVEAILHLCRVGGVILLIIGSVFVVAFDVD
jgi:hypothetical protein